MGKVLVRNPGTGKVLLCCWDTCESAGDNRVQEVVTDGIYTEADMVSPLMLGTPKRFTYIFCKERHREFWRNSHRDMGNLPAGLRTPR
jgi:hypothetical protein